MEESVDKPEDKIKSIKEGAVDGRNSMKPVYIEAHDLNDAWFQCVNKVLDDGCVYQITKGSYAGSYRWEFDYATIRIKNPGNRPLTPIMPEGSGLPPPTNDEKAKKYADRYLLSDEKTETEEYTYGERITNPKIRLDEIINIDSTREKTGIDFNNLNDKQVMALYSNIKKIQRNGNEIELFKEIPYEINSIFKVIEHYKEQGYGSNQEILQVGMPMDIVLLDPPCLRHIDTRIRYGKLHFFPYFRSWDLWGGFPENLAGIQLLKEFMAGEIGVEDGEIIAASKGLHIYKYVWELAALRANKQLPVDYKEDKEK